MEFLTQQNRRVGGEAVGGADILATALVPWRADWSFTSPPQNCEVNCSRSYPRTKSGRPMYLRDTTASSGPMATLDWKRQAKTRS